MILEIVSVGIVVSACLAIFFDEAVYSVAALAGTFMLTALLYALSGATYVAIFQFAVAIGTLAILFLSGEMLSEKSLTKTKPIVHDCSSCIRRSFDFASDFYHNFFSKLCFIFRITFGEALWNFNAVDVVLQGLVILTLALGITIVLFERKKKPGEKRNGCSIMDYVILSLVMLAVGIYGLLTKRHLLKIFISIELIATGATLNFVMLGINNLGVSQDFLILAFSTDTAVSAVILALLVIVSKKYGTSDISKIVKPEEAQDNK